MTSYVLDLCEKENESTDHLPVLWMLLSCSSGSLVKTADIVKTGKFLNGKIVNMGTAMDYYGSG